MPGRRREKSEPREKARKSESVGEREKLIATSDPSIALMADDIIVVEADP